MWPFSSLKILDRASREPRNDLEPLHAALNALREQSATSNERLDSVESQHRSDRLELLDLHERVKTSLAKLNRRSRESSPTEEEPDEQVQPSNSSPGQSLTRVSLLSRRGRR
jgi:hypothetical protein